MISLRFHFLTSDEHVFNCGFIREHLGVVVLASCLRGYISNEALQLHPILFTGLVSTNLEDALICGYVDDLRLVDFLCQEQIQGVHLG